MNSIANAVGAPVQNVPQVAASAQASAAAAPQATVAKGDTVTISKEGKELAKASGHKEGGGIVTGIKAATTVSKATLTDALQTAKTTQKSLKAKLEAAKLQAESNPGGSDDVAKLNVKLNDINATVSKDQVKVNT